MANLRTFTALCRPTAWVLLWVLVAGCDNDATSTAAVPATRAAAPAPTTNQEGARRNAQTSADKGPPADKGPIVSYAGHVVTTFGKANAGVSVSYGDAQDMTDADGAFQLNVYERDLPAGAGPGYRPRATFRRRGYLTRQLPLTPGMGAGEDRRYSMFEGGVVEGMVTGIGGKPLPGARVAVDGHGSYHEECVADESGRYSVTAPEGTLLFSVHSDTHADQRIYDITVRPETSVTRNLELDKGHTLQVVVTGNGVALKGASIRTRTRDGDDTTVESDHLGHCTIEGLNTGMATCKILCPGFGEVFERIDLKPGTTSRSFALVSVPYWEQKVVNDAGHKLSGVEVEIHRHNELLVRAATNTRALQVMNPGDRYELRFFAAGYPTRSYTYRFPTDDLFPIVRAEMIKGGSIVGRIEDSRGMPLPDASVFIFPSDRATPRNANLAAWVNADGNFRSALLAPGKYRVQAHHPRTHQTVKLVTLDGHEISVGTLVLDQK